MLWLWSLDFGNLEMVEFIDDTWKWWFPYVDGRRNSLMCFLMISIYHLQLCLQSVSQLNRRPVFSSTLLSHQLSFLFMLWLLLICQFIIEISVLCWYLIWYQASVWSQGTRCSVSVTPYFHQGSELECLSI